MAQVIIDFQKFSEFQSSQSKEGEERDMQTLMSTFSGEPESQQDLNFFQDDRDVPKKKIRTAKSSYSNTKVKSRNLSTNVLYRRYKQQDFNNASFVIDILSFLVQNFNAINLDRKLDNENERLYV